MNCPRCESECYRDEVDVGVGVISGPYGCPNCGWSEYQEYDVSEEPKFTEFGELDQFGGLTPIPWKAYYGGGFCCPDGQKHLPPSVPDTVDEILCERCGVLLCKTQ